MNFSHMAQNTGCRNACRSFKVMTIIPQNSTVGTNLCPLTGKTFSTFPPLLMISSSSASTHSETSRMRLPQGVIGCVNWPDLPWYFVILSLFKNHSCILASCLQISGINLTCWSWHLSSKILVNLEELKVHLGELVQLQNLENMGACTAPVDFQRFPAWTFHSMTLLSCSLSFPWVPHLPWEWKRKLGIITPW